MCLLTYDCWLPNCYMVSENRIRLLFPTTELLYVD